MDIQTRLDRLAQRRTDPTLFEASAKSYESYRSIDAPEAVRYIIGSMQPIDERYTRRTVEQGERVRDQLKKRLPESVDYRFQGSVLTDTHIRLHSDIDLLVFMHKFVFCKPPLEPHSPYAGNPVQDMRDLRRDTKDALERAFPQATVDDSGTRSIEISGGSLARDVDVVPAAWFNTVEYERTQNEVHRGVQVFNKGDGSFAANYPFKNAAEIDAKDRRCSGGMRKAARFMKTLKADSSSIDLSSYDITALAWNMPDSSLSYSMPWDIKIFFGCRSFLQQVVEDAVFRESLVVPDGSRRVFADGHAKVSGVRALLADVNELAAELSHLVASRMELKPYGLEIPVRYAEVRGHAPLRG